MYVYLSQTTIIGIKFYLVSVHEEEDEEDQFSQQDDEQNNEELFKKDKTAEVNGLNILHLDSVVMSSKLLKAQWGAVSTPAPTEYSYQAGRSQKKQT